MKNRTFTFGDLLRCGLRGKASQRIWGRTAVSGILLFLSFVEAGHCKGELNDRVCFKNECYTVEVAANERTRMRGLQGREQLGAREGMLFVFPESRAFRFWMKETLIPLDMIWLDYGQKVVHIEQNVPPCVADPCPSYGPKQAALYVLELNSGESARLGLKVGERMSFQLKKYLGRK